MDCLHCGAQLQGKQQRFCSDRCRKAHSRNPDSPDNAPNQLVGCAAIVPKLSAEQRQAVRANLAAIAAHEAQWSRRCQAADLGGPATIHRLCSDLVRSLVDLV